MKCFFLRFVFSTNIWISGGKVFVSGRAEFCLVHAMTLQVDQDHPQQSAGATTVTPSGAEDEIQYWTILAMFPTTFTSPKLLILLLSCENSLYTLGRLLY